MHTIKKIILLVACTIVLTTICYANWGGTKWGGQNFGSGKWGTTQQDLSGTYWYTDNTAYWAVDNTALWNTTTDTEVP